MSMDGDVGNAVGSAMMIGLQIGLQRQRDKAAGSWEHYAHELEDKLAKANGIIDQLYKERIDKSVALIFEEQQTSDLKRELQRMQGALAIQQGLLKKEQEKGEGLNRYITFLHAKASTREKDFVRQSIDSAVLHYLYEQLVDEINEISNPANFPSLDLNARMEIIIAKTREFEHTCEHNAGYKIVLKSPVR